MVNSGDAAKQVWLLEWGWTADKVHPNYAWFAVSEDKKASNIIDAFQYARDHWAPWIGVMYVWTLPDPTWDTEPRGILVGDRRSRWHPAGGLHTDSDRSPERFAAVNSGHLAGASHKFRSLPKGRVILTKEGTIKSLVRSNGSFAGSG